MSDLYLIAHKVRGEPAFDVAVRMDCPECAGKMGRAADACTECEGLGYWWIIPTSGHRAYPIISWPLSALRTVNYDGGELAELCTKYLASHSGWPDLPDHYTTRAEPKVSLADRLGLAAKPQPPLKRRF